MIDTLIGIALVIASTMGGHSATPETPDQLILAQPTVCQEQARAAALASVRDTGFRWVWAELSNAAGLTWDTGTVALAASTPCDQVASLVLHEWMHTAGSLGPIPGLPDQISGTESYEIVADCGSSLLVDSLDDPNTQDVRPYSDAAGGCTEAIDAAALSIING
jgi:hypothetical protein